MADRKDLTLILNLILTEYGFHLEKEHECTDYDFEISTTWKIYIGIFKQNKSLKIAWNYITFCNILSINKGNTTQVYLWRFHNHWPTCSGKYHKFAILFSPDRFKNTSVPSQLRSGEWKALKAKIFMSETVNLSLPSCTVLQHLRKTAAGSLIAIACTHSAQSHFLQLI